MRDVISTSTSLSSHSSSLLIPSLLKQRSYVRLLVSNIAFKLARRDSGKTKLSRLGTQGTKPSQTLSSIICPEIRNLVETHFFLISRWKITLRHILVYHPTCESQQQLDQMNQIQGVFLSRISQDQLKLEQKKEMSNRLIEYRKKYFPTIIKITMRKYWYWITVNFISFINTIFTNYWARTQRLRHKK